MVRSKFADLEKITLKNRGGLNPNTGRVNTGLRSNPDYVQLSIYVRKDTHHRVFGALHARNDKSTFSGLVQELLENWLATQKTK
jgi:hypothetical protein